MKLEVGITNKKNQTIIQISIIVLIFFYNFVAPKRQLASFRKAANGRMNKNYGTNIFLEKSTSTGITPDVLPETRSDTLAEGSQTGVSTCCAHKPTTANPTTHGNHYPPDLLSSPHWYALRTTYGREKKACDYMTAKGATVFCPTIQQTRLIDGKRRKVTVSRLPNIFFAYGTEDELKTFVYDNVNLPYLRFYYRHFHNGSKR